LTIGNYNNEGATTMDDEDHSNNEETTIVVISFSNVKRVHIWGLPSSMILQKKIICKTKIKTDKNTFNTYKNKVKKTKIKKSFQNQP
jgi:hypothetical protein